MSRFAALTRLFRSGAIHYGFALIAAMSLILTLTVGIALLMQTSPPGSVVEFQFGSMGIVWMLWGAMWTIVWAVFAIQRGKRKSD